MIIKIPSIDPVLLIFFRYNALGKDLNRNFPDLINPVDDHENFQQPETKAVMDWIHENSFMFSMSYFTGALVVSYPFDTVPIGGKQ